MTLKFQLKTRLLSTGAFSRVKNTLDYLFIKKVEKNQSLITFTNSNFQKDGLGAQLERLASIAILSRRIGTKFSFHAFDRIELQPTDSSLLKDSYAEYINRTNQLAFHLLRNLKIENYASLGTPVINVSSTWRKILFILAPIFKEVHLVLDDAYPFAPFFRDFWRVHDYPLQLQEINAIQKPTSAIFVNLHIRSSNLSRNSDRYVPPDYYREALRSILGITTLAGMSIQVTIYHDLHSIENLDVIEGDFFTPESIEYWKHLELIDSNNRVTRNPFLVLDNLITSLQSITPDLRVSPERDSIKGLIGLSDCDILVESVSSYSRLAAILGAKKMIISPVKSRREGVSICVYNELTLAQQNQPGL